MIIDDEEALLHAYRRFFREPDIRLVTAATGTDGTGLFERHRPDAVILDLNLPDRPGLEVLCDLHALDARVPVIVMTGQARSEPAIEAMKLGAYDCVFKPQGLAQVREMVAAALRVSRMMRVPALTPDQPAEATADLIVGSCPPMREVYKAIGRVAPKDVTVLVLGESGTGKELVARAIYQHSSRADKPFLAINCAAIPEGLLESELFGHEKGAFTGADRQRIGKFEQASGGTIFLDEIGDMTPATQAKVLRLLQDQRFERVGGSEIIQTDVRLIAATNRNLREDVREGRFRPDLYYRLSTFVISLPPLRERLEDLPLLVNYFLHRYSAELGRQVQETSPEALAALRGHDWPGNVRELQAVLKQALLHAKGPVLLPEFLPVSLTRGLAGRPALTVSECPGLDTIIAERLDAGEPNLYAAVHALVDRHLLSQVLTRTGGNQLRAARLLGLTRGKLRGLLRELGLAPVRQADDWSAEDQTEDEGGSEGTNSLAPDGS